MGKTTNQHYVPQFYLKKFDSGNDQIFVFDKFNNRVFPTNVRNVASEKGFYDLPERESNDLGIDISLVDEELKKMEDLFPKSLDYVINQVYKKRRRRGLFTEYHKKVMALFLIIQFIRTRENRKLIEDSIDLFGEALLEEFDDLNRAEYSVERGKDMSSLVQAGMIFDEDTLLRFVEGLLTHIWIIGKNNTENPLYTSDNPVVRTPHYSDPYKSYSGLGSYGIEIAFPLNSQLILLLFERNAFKNHLDKENKIISLDDENVEYYNSFQVSRSYQRVFCSSNNFKLIREMQQTHPNFFILNRKRVVRG